MKEHSSDENIFQEAKGSVEVPKKQGLEVVVSSSPDSLQGKLGTLSDAIGHDQPITDANLADLSSAVEGMKLNIGGKEITLKDIESLKAISTFLKKTNTGWGVEEEELPTFKFEFTDPKELDYKNKSGHSDQSKFGQYTLNPETFGMDFEKAKVFIPDLPAMNGKELQEVFKYVVETYGDRYYIPGIEYWKWMMENPDKAEESAKKQNYDIKDGDYFYFPGSSLCGSNGDWNVPYFRWDGGKFRQLANWLGGGWDFSDSIVLLEREK